MAPPLFHHFTMDFVICTTYVTFVKMIRNKIVKSVKKIVHVCDVTLVYIGD